MKEENGGESRVAKLHQTMWATWRVPPNPRGRSVPGSAAAVLVWCALGAAETRAERVRASPFLLAPHLTPPWDYVHASLGFMDVERGAKVGLGGMSGFSEGVRFSPDLVNEL